MFKPICIIIIFIIPVLNCLAQSYSFSILNPLAIERNNELVILKRAELEKHAGIITDDFRYKIVSPKKEIIYQTVDINNDGIWDELVFLSSFKSNEKKLFTITSAIIPKQVREDTTQPLAHVRMKPKNADDSFGKSVTYAEMAYKNSPTDFSKQKLPSWLTEGPGWENDKVAFRLYFDARNTIDIYGKRISGMVMDTVGANPNNSYHDLSAWGMDILHVAKSLGAGSLAISTKDKNGKDTLIRLGGENILKEAYQQLADGPLYAAFEMSYQWQINNKPVTIKEQVSIWGGQYFYESTVTVVGAPQDSKLITGIADFYDNRVDSFHIDKAAVLLSHGKQSENKDELGMAALLPQQTFSFFSEAPKTNSDITETHLAAQNIIDDKPLTFRFYSCWSKTDEQFISKDYFKIFMQTEAKKFSNPLMIQWK